MARGNLTYLLVQILGYIIANRCLVPASGFYEWKTDGREKTPYYIYPKSNQFFSPEKVLR